MARLDGNGFPIIETSPRPTKRSTWDCVDPCAIIVRCLKNGLVMTNEIQTTLDAKGWFDESGQPDYNKAEREFERFANEP